MMFLRTVFHSEKGVARQVVLEDIHCVFSVDAENPQDEASIEKHIEDEAMTPLIG